MIKTILTLLVSTGAALSLSAERPNILFIAVDDMNDWVGCLKNKTSAITPNIDKLAARGVNFTNAQTAGVFCAPSRAAIFSGQYASTTGCYKTAYYFENKPEIEPMQVAFQKAGYDTFGGGKLFHHPAGCIDQRGWTEFYFRNESQYEDGWQVNSWGKDVPFPDPWPNSIYNLTYNKGKKMNGGMFLEWGSVPDEKEEELADTKRANWAVSKLEEQYDKPFFLAVGLYAPHYPNYCPEKYFDLYDPEKVQLPPINENDLDDIPEKMRNRKISRKKHHYDRLVAIDAYDDAVRGYLACISYADAMIGRILDALDASPYADNTIVVLWSDHGYHLGEKGDWGKHTLWERSSNVPFIWAGPSIAVGKKTDVTVSLIDMYPTFAKFCKFDKSPQKLEGEAINKILASPDKAKDRDVYLPYMSPNAYAVINKKWRYIRYEDGGEELYNVKKDPNEWKNLLHGKEPTERLKQTIASLQKSAPSEFEDHEYNWNKNKELVKDGTKFRWVKKTKPAKKK